MKEPLDLWPVIEKSMTNIMRSHGHSDEEIVKAIEILWKEYEAGKRGERIYSEQNNSAVQNNSTGRKWTPAAASHPED